mgnify:CR=1 FL=1
MPSGPIYAVDDMLGDDHYNARENFESVDVGGRPLKIPSLCPRLQRGRGRSEWAGPELGQHTRQVLEGLLGMPPARVDELVASGAVALAPAEAA